jgi:hypothetical protein
LNGIFQEYGDRAAFFVVYIREAHPTDAWQVSSNVKDEVLLASPAAGGRRADLRAEAGDRAAGAARRLR